ncbi:hypothetical protein U1Q18_022495, partial [Sarracenia purpurea var. burkii]
FPFIFNGREDEVYTIVAGTSQIKHGIGQIRHRKLIINVYPVSNGRGTRTPTARHAVAASTARRCTGTQPEVPAHMIGEGSAGALTATDIH